MGLIRIRREQLPRYQEKLRELEQLADYPIGDDRFVIDHGPDYLRFFERLGEVFYFAQQDGDHLAAVACSMLRRVPYRQGETPQKCWYGADVKVHPDYRNQRIPLSIAYKVFIPLAMRCLRGYVVSMNPGDGSPNRIVKLAKAFEWTPVDVSGILRLYSLDADRMAALTPVVERHRGPISYLSLAGIKDIVLQSTGRPMPLLHVQWGHCAEAGRPEPVPGSVHMFSALEDDPLAHEMAERGVEPSATATVISSGMRRSDFRFILTSDI